MRLFYLIILFTFFFSQHNVLAFAAVPLSTDCVLTAFLKVGSRGAEVQCLQGKVGTVTDGIFGPLTYIAVKAFQSSHGLVADGIVGPLSRTALNDVVASGSIYPAGCVGITGYSITTGLKCDSIPSSKVSNSVVAGMGKAPLIADGSNQKQEPSMGSANSATNTNPNLLNLERLIKTVVEVNRKNGYSEKDLELMANALREEVASSKMNYNEEFKKMLIREASLSSNTKPFLTVFNKVVARTFSFLGIIPSMAEAAIGALDVSFGGALLDSVFCVLSGNWMITLEPLPPSFIVLISYTPGTQGFASFNIPYTSYLLGTYTPSGVCVLSKKATIPTEGTITPMVGSSPFSPLSI